MSAQPSGTPVGQPPLPVEPVGPTVVPTLPPRRAEADPARPPAARRRALTFLWVASVLGGLGQSLAGAAGALLISRVTGSDAGAGAPQAMIVIGAAVAALVLSGLTRRRGRGRALMGGALVAVPGALAVVAGAVVGSVPAILLGSLLLGSGNAALMLGRYAAADLAHEAVRARAMASVLLATTVGTVVGPNLLAAAGAVGRGWGLPELAGPYLFAAGTSLVAAFALGIGLGPATRVTAGHRAPRLRAAALGRTGLAGLAALSLANLVMVGVMTMVPVHLHHSGSSLRAIGLVVSLHIAAMFAPAPLSGWLTDRFGGPRVVALAGLVLAGACGLAATGAGSSVALPIALVVLGVGWNLALVSGSVLLTSGASALDRPRREGWGEVTMGAAAAGGGVTSGLLMSAGGYASLAVAGAAVAALLVPVAGPLIRRR